MILRIECSKWRIEEREKIKHKEHKGGAEYTEEKGSKGLQPLVKGGMEYSGNSLEIATPLVRLGARNDKGRFGVMKEGQTRGAAPTKRKKGRADAHPYGGMIMRLLRRFARSRLRLSSSLRSS